MAQSVKFHGKYKGVIVARTDVKKLRDKLNLGRGKLIDLLVENMSYYICPDCGHKHYLFGESHIDEIAKKFNISTVCRLPMDPAITKVVDAGLIETITQMELMPIVNELMKEE